MADNSQTPPSPKLFNRGNANTKPSMKRAAPRDDVETQPLLQESSPPSPHVTLTVAEVASESGHVSESHHSEDCRKCRICLEEEDETPKAGKKSSDNPLISPCLCAGSTKYVHRKCLEEWRNNGHRQDAFYRCEICKYEYRFQRVMWARILGSTWTVSLIFIIVMVSSCFFLGFIPIFSLKQIETTTHFNWWLLHAANGALNMGIIGLIASLVLGCLAMCDRMPGGNLFYCPSCPLIFDCGALDIAACGEAGVACLLVFVVIGFCVASYVVYVLLYTLIQSCLKNVERMVENVSS